MRAKSIKNKHIKFLLEKDVTEKKIIDNMNFLVQKNLPKKFSSNRDKICDVIHANLITDLKKYHIKQQ